MKPARSSSLVALACALSSTPAVAQTTEPVHEYVAQNGRTVRISEYGNLVSFQSSPGLEDINVKRSRDGYVLSYQMPGEVRRTIFNVHDLPISSVIRPGLPDFVLKPFTGPTVSRGIPSDTRLKATATVETQDGAIRLTIQYQWRAGYGHVIRVITAEFLRDAKFLGFKWLTDADVAGKPVNDCVRSGGGAICVATRCLAQYECPPPCSPSDPDCNDKYRMQAFSIYGYPRPTYASIRSYSDNSELLFSDLVTAGDLAGFRPNEDNQLSIGWTQDESKTARQTIVWWVGSGVN